MSIRARGRVRASIGLVQAILNIFDSPDDLTSGDWSKLVGTVQSGITDPDGGTGAHRVTFTNVGKLQQIHNLVPGRDYRFRGSIAAPVADLTLSIYMQNNGGNFSLSTWVSNTNLLNAEGYRAFDETVTLGTDKITSQRVVVDVGNTDVIDVFNLILTDETGDSINA